MIITKFKIFESNGYWSNDKLKSHIEDRKNLSELLSKYVKYKTNNNNNVDVYDYYFDKKNKFYIHYYDETQNIYGVVEDYDELINFLKNPELFIKSKKYNL